MCTPPTRRSACPAPARGLSGPVRRCWRRRRSSGADLIHPGYGFLSENAEFADACATGGYTFVGPDAEVLELLGNKSSARGAAIAAGVPVLPATEGPSSVEDIRAFFAEQGGGIMIKALAGGGGRGMRKVHSADQIDDAYRRAPPRRSWASAIPRCSPRRCSPTRAHRGADRRRAGRAPDARARARRPRLQHPAALPEARRNRSRSRAFG